MKPRLRPGMVLAPMPFAGAFVVDRSQLAVVELDDELATWLSHPTNPAPPALLEQIALGVERGWLIAELDDEPSPADPSTGQE